MTKRTALYARIDEDKIKRLRKRLIDDKTTIRDFIERCVDDYLERDERGY